MADGPEKNLPRPASLREELGLSGLAARLFEARVQSQALSLTRFSGFLAITLIVLLIISGAFMALYYTPAPGTAYDSVDYAQFSLPFGDVVRGVHHYSWNLLLMVLGLHLIRALVSGAYLNGRRLAWVSGVLLMLLIPAFLITGDLLPWDQKGYWTTQVRISIMTSVPLVGRHLVSLLQGGPRLGIVALTRFYALHLIFLPAALAALVWLHLHLVAHRGLSLPLNPDRRPSRTIPLVKLAVRCLILLLLSGVILGWISYRWPAPLGDPADPTDSSFVPKPEWWVLFLNQLVSLFRGAMSVIGTTLIPGALAGLLIFLPWLDRAQGRDPRGRKGILAAAFLILSLILVLSVMGYREHFTAQAH